MQHKKTRTLPIIEHPLVIQKIKDIVSTFPPITPTYKDLSAIVDQGTQSWIEKMNKSNLVMISSPRRKDWETGFVNSYVCLTYFNRFSDDNRYRAQLHNLITTWGRHVSRNHYLRGIDCDYIIKGILLQKTAVLELMSESFFSFANSKVHEAYDLMIEAAVTECIEISDQSKYNLAKAISAYIPITDVPFQLEELCDYIISTRDLSLCGELYTLVLNYDGKSFFRGTRKISDKYRDEILQEFSDICMNGGSEVKTTAFQDFEFPDDGYTSAREYSARLSAPIILEGRAIGMLSAHSRVYYEYNERDRHLLKALAERAGETLHHFAFIIGIYDKLKISEKKYRELVEYSDDFIFSLDPKARYLSINKAGLGVSKLAEEKIIGKTALEAFPNRTGALLHQDNLAAIQAKGPLELERELKYDGQKRYISTRCSQIMDKEGNLQQVVCVGRDITERKKWESEMLAYSKELEILNSIAMSVSQTLELGDLLHKILTQTCRLLDEVETGAIYIVCDGSDTNMRLKARGNFPNDFIKMVMESLCQVVVSQVARKISIVELSVSSCIPRCVTSLVETTELRSIVGIPLLSKRKLVGVLVLLMKSSPPLIQKQAAILKVIGHQIGVGIENSMLYGNIKQSEEQSKLFSQRLLQVQEKERLKISRELHDQLGQTLLALKFDLRSMKRRVPSVKPDLSAEISVILEGLERAIEEVRGLARDLRPSLLEDVGLASAIAELVDQFAKRTGIQVTSQIDSIDGLLTREAEINVYRILRECFSNIIRHSHALSAWFTACRTNNSLIFSVQDDGQGFDECVLAAKNPSERGLGLVSIHERVSLLGGKAHIQSSVGEGTTVFFEVPLLDKR